MRQWDSEKREWEQVCGGAANMRLTYHLHRLVPRAEYVVSFDKKGEERLMSDEKGELVLSLLAGVKEISIKRRVP
jgi:hypothetical protein